MKVFLLLLISLFILKEIKCQIIGTVSGKINRKRIPYAMIIDSDSSFCIFSDSVGKFCIDQNLLKSKPQLYVSASNYPSQKIESITNNFEIELNPFLENSLKINSNKVSIKNKNRLKQIGIPKLNLIKLS